VAEVRQLIQRLTQSAHRSLLLEILVLLPELVTPSLIGPLILKALALFMGLDLPFQLAQAM
jgi:hypothetical protein